MRQIGGGCDAGDTCPGVFEDGETVVVRGAVVAEAVLDRGEGEAAVRLPRALLLAAAAQLGEGPR
jgi:hypothetical protein